MQAQPAYRIKQITLSGFRRLYSLTIPMKNHPFMVMIGANGVGKTSLCDAFTILSSSAAGTLDSTLSKFGGVANILTRGKSDSLSFSIDMEVPNHLPLHYELSLSCKGTGYSITSETLSQPKEGFSENHPFKYIIATNGNVRYYDTDQAKLLAPEWELHATETALAQVPKMYRQPEELRRILATVTQYHALDVSERAQVKMPQPMKPALLPGANGEDLVPYLYYLRETNRDRFENITDILRAAYPDFVEITFPPVAAGMLTMMWQDRKFNKPIYIHELSEGTLRFLWLVALLQSPHLSTVTMIDEPEISLHPELLSLLADLMRETSNRTQLIVATHSDRLIRFLKPEEVLVMDVDEHGSTTATWADELDIEHWLKEYTLDEVWQMGRIGGRA